MNSCSNENRVRKYRIGEVYMMQFDGDGSEQRGWRPGIVFQNNLGNKFSPTIIALPLTTIIKKSSQPTHVLIKASKGGLRKDSMVLCENLRCLHKDKVGCYVTTLSDTTMCEVAKASMVATGALSFISLDVLLRLRNFVAQVNVVM